MAWRRPGDKPLSEPMMVSLVTHICVTRPQRVNTSYHLLLSPPRLPLLQVLLHHHHHHHHHNYNYHRHYCRLLLLLLQHRLQTQSKNKPHGQYKILYEFINIVETSSLILYFLLWSNYISVNKWSFKNDHAHKFIFYLESCLILSGAETRIFQENKVYPMGVNVQWQSNISSNL